MTGRTEGTLAGIVARLESLERVARNRGSLACDHLAEQAADIRRDLEKFAAAAPGICSGHSAGGSGHMPTAAEAQPVGTVAVSGIGHTVNWTYPPPPIGTPLYAHPSPSAPMGVDKETQRRLVDAAAGILNDNNGKIGKKHFRADAAAVVRRVLKALAQQPAAVDGAKPEWCPTCGIGRPTEADWEKGVES